MAKGRKDLKRGQLEGLDVYVAGKTTLNDLSGRHISMKHDLRNTTRNNTFICMTGLSEIHLD